MIIISKWSNEVALFENRQYADFKIQILSLTASKQLFSTQLHKKKKTCTHYECLLIVLALSLWTDDHKPCKTDPGWDGRIFNFNQDLQPQFDSDVVPRSQMLPGVPRMSWVQSLSNGSLWRELKMAFDIVLTPSGGSTACYSTMCC